MRIPAVRCCLTAVFIAAALVPSVADAAKEDRIAKLVASADGRSKNGAYRVKSVEEEYKILAALGLRPSTQSLIMGDDRRAYDLIEAEDPTTGEKREVWFDISRFFGRGF